MASFWYKAGWCEVACNRIDVTSDELRIMLVGSTYSPNANSIAVDDGTAADLASKEINVTGYTAGYGEASRKVAVITFGIDWATNRTTLNVGDLSWADLGAGATIGYAVLFKSGDPDDTTSIPIYCYDIDNIVTDGGTETVTFAPVPFVPLVSPSRAWNW